VPDEDLNDVTVRGRIVTNISWETPRMPGLDVAPPVAKKVIGIAGRFAPDISELLVPYILAQAIEHALAASKDIALRFYDTFCDRKHSVSICEGVEKLLHEAIDALCVIYPEPEDVEAILTSAQCTRTPVLFISPEVLSEPVAQVYIDHRYDGYQAAKYFLDMGHKEILYIHLAEHHWSYERLKGIQAAARFAGLPESAVRVHPESGADQLPGHPESFLKPLQAWARTELSRGTLRGALIAANDQVALSILDVAEAIGVTTNSGFSLLGFDDVPQARRRGLTTLRPPLYDMGREAARLLETLLNQGEIRGESIHSRMISQIVVRSSAA